MPGQIKRVAFMKMEYHSAMQRNKGPIHATTWRTSKTLCTSVKKAGHKRPFTVMWCPKQANRQRQEVGRWPAKSGMRVQVGNRKWLLTNGEFLFRVKKISEIRLWWSSHNSENLWKPRNCTRYMSEEWILCHDLMNPIFMNCMSTKLFKK